MTDYFSEYRAGLRDPLENAFAITPNDSADLSYTTRAIYVGGSGNVKATLVGGDTVTFSSVPVGVLWIRATKVFATGTTATNLLGLY